MSTSAEVIKHLDELTKQRVEDILGKKIECPLGDPGLLAEKLIDKNIKKVYILFLVKISILGRKKL